MKKLSSLPILFLIVTSCTTGQKKAKNAVKKEKTDWIKENFKGKIKSATWITYEGKIINGHAQKGEKTDSSIWIYNEQGYNTEGTRYNNAGLLRTKLTYEFDHNDNLLEETIMMANGEIASKKEL